MLAVILSVACCILSVSASLEGPADASGFSMEVVVNQLTDGSNKVLGDISRSELWPAFIALAAGLLMSLAACFKLPQNLMRFLALCVIGTTAYFVYWFSFAGGVETVLAAE